MYDIKEADIHKWVWHLLNIDDVQFTDHGVMDNSFVCNVVIMIHYCGLCIYPSKDGAPVIPSILR